MNSIFSVKSFTLKKKRKEKKHTHTHTPTHTHYKNTDVWIVAGSVLLYGLSEYFKVISDEAKTTENVFFSFGKADEYFGNISAPNVVTN